MLTNLNTTIVLNIQSWKQKNHLSVLFQIQNKNIHSFKQCDWTLDLLLMIGFFLSFSSFHTITGIAAKTSQYLLLVVQTEWYDMRAGWNVVADQLLLSIWLSKKRAILIGRKNLFTAASLQINCYCLFKSFAEKEILYIWIGPKSLRKKIGNARKRKTGT